MKQSESPKMPETDPKIPARLGCLVEVELISQAGTGEKLAFTLVEDDQADFSPVSLAWARPWLAPSSGKWPESSFHITPET